jgi:hypothetical protein
MKIKITIKLKNGRKIEVIKRLSDPPKGTDINTHYMLESVDMVEKMRDNGLCLSISPAQIGDIFIQPRAEGNKNGPSRNVDHMRQNLQGAGLHSASPA